LGLQGPTRQKKRLDASYGGGGEKKNKTKKEEPTSLDEEGKKEDEIFREKKHLVKFFRGACRKPGER